MLKYHNPFVSIILILFILIFIIDCTSVSAKSKTDYQIVKEYCKKNYPKQTIKVVTKYNPKIMENRKDKNIVYVERFVSYSQGSYGYSKKGEYVRYNKKVRKGKKVISYFIYNPKTNYCDDVVAVIDCGKVR